MIGVGQVGVNSFTLTGDKLSVGGLDTSSVALHKSGWSVKLHWDRELRRSVLVRYELARKEVIPAIKEMIASYEDSEDVNEHEIRIYMDNVYATCSKHGFLDGKVEGSPEQELPAFPMFIPQAGHKFGCNDTSAPVSCTPYQLSRVYDILRLAEAAFGTDVKKTVWASFDTKVKVDFNYSSWAYVTEFNH